MQKEMRILIFTLLIFSYLKLPGSPPYTTPVKMLNDLFFNNLYTDNDIAMWQTCEALKPLKQLRFQKGETNVYNRIGVAYNVKGDFDGVLPNMGLTDLKKGDYTNILSSFHPAIKPLRFMAKEPPLPLLCSYNRTK